MKKYLILVKHSLPEVVENLPAPEWRLSDSGRVRAEHLASQLATFQPDLMFSSSEQKAKETAEIVGRRLQLEVQIIPNLHEHDRSNVSHLSQDQFQTLVREFFQKPNELVFGKETADQCHARFYRAMHSVLSEYRNKTIVIVTHGTVVSLFVSRLTGSSGFEFWNRLDLPSFIAMDLHSNTLMVRDNIL